MGRALRHPVECEKASELQPDVAFASIYLLKTPH